MMKKHYNQRLNVILLVCISFLLFQSCEKDDTSAQLQLELNEIKTVSPENAIDYLNSFKKSKSKS